MIYLILSLFCIIAAIICYWDPRIDVDDRNDKIYLWYNKYTKGGGVERTFKEL